jgi:hypothetical protein
MNSKKTIVFIFLAISILFIAFIPERSSSGSPASHTGAPNEKTCAASGCHDDNKINTGTAQLCICFGNEEKQYVVGQTYSMKVKIMDPKVNRFGFQLLALDSKNNNAGSFKIIDSIRTKLTFNDAVQALKNRSYVTYTFSGTDAAISGESEWTVNWKAPSTAVGTITFYAAAVSANDDMSDKGDHSYTASTRIKN